MIISYHIFKMLGIDHHHLRQKYYQQKFRATVDFDHLVSQEKCKNLGPLDKVTIHNADAHDGRVLHLA